MGRRCASGHGAGAAPEREATPPGLSTRLRRCMLALGEVPLGAGGYVFRTLDC